MENNNTTRGEDRVKAVNQNLAQSRRAAIMAALARKAFTDKVKALEIGVWYGAGSTNIWLDNFMPGSDLVLVDAWRPYASSADVSGDDFGAANWDYAKMDSLSSEAFLSAFLNVRKFENEIDDKNVSLIRGKSSALLPLFKEDCFDFIYIDADHKYESVKADIVNAKRLVNKNFGIVCGDDLEKLPTPELVDLARQYKDRDYIKGDYGYHPGVCLAVSEEFASVNMSDGFWWVVCKNGEFLTDQLDLEYLQAE
ncbi:class I SAM-dependent methyltransferase [Hoeflea sp. AS16]|uniref:class I SAM-dependent methyltransferase n=1 Tax=Hoeflea sp. AS16 TaxID=3135779 RepID=UPI0031778438